MLLTVGFTVIALALVLVVTDASKVFLTRRSLVSAADGAALAGVQSLDRTAFYAGNDDAALPLDVDAASAAVREVRRPRRPRRRLRGLRSRLRPGQRGGGDCDPARPQQAALRGYVGHPHGVLIEATAHATAPYVN